MAVAIVYGEASGIVRRFVQVSQVYGDDRQIDIVATLNQLAGHYGPGESIIMVDDDEIMKLTEQGLLPDLPYAQRAVADKRGAPSEEARCLVINDETGDIETVIQADPLIDALPSRTLYQHPDAGMNWAVDEEGEFAPPIEEVLSPTDGDV